MLLNILSPAPQVEDKKEEREAVKGDFSRRRRKEQSPKLDVTYRYHLVFGVFDKYSRDLKIKRLRRPEVPTLIIPALRPK